jgi:hypothetical protein
MLVIHTSLLSVHTWTVRSPLLWNADLHILKWLASCSGIGGLSLVSPHSASSLAFLSSIIATFLTLLYSGLIGEMILA